LPACFTTFSSKAQTILREYYEKQFANENVFPNLDGYIAEEKWHPHVQAVFGLFCANSVFDGAILVFLILACLRGISVRLFLENAPKAIC
jgi:hypothetical protein